VHTPGLPLSSRPTELRLPPKVACSFRLHLIILYPIKSLHGGGLAFFSFIKDSLFCYHGCCLETDAYGRHSVGYDPDLNWIKCDTSWVGTYGLGWQSTNTAYLKVCVPPGRVITIGSLSPLDIRQLPICLSLHTGRDPKLYLHILDNFCCIRYNAHHLILRVGDKPTTCLVKLSIQLR